MKISKKPLVPFGTFIKHRLVEVNRTQIWLIAQVKKILPHRYVDSSYLHKIMVGEVNNQEVISAISFVLNNSL